MNIIVNICFFNISAGWSSLVARQAHNLKVVGSNPTPATNYFFFINIWISEDNFFLSRQY